MGTLLIVTVLSGLVVFILTFMLHTLDGPFDVFYRIRNVLGVYDEDNEGFFSKLLQCYWCTATWVGAVVSVLTVIAYGFPIVWFIHAWLGGVTIAGVIYEIVS